MHKKTILIADDEPHITYMLKLKLSGAGFTVITASDGRQGYELACEHRPDLVVSDFRMPVCDGLELCRLLKENPETAAIPALMLTARGYKIPLRDLAETNIQCVLDKPFSPQALIAQIQEMLNLAPPPDQRGPNDAEAAAA